MANSLSNIVYNLTEGIHRIKCKYSDFFPEYKHFPVYYLAINVIQKSLMKN